MIVDRDHSAPSATVGEAREIMSGHNISGVPITVNGRLRGILTRRDLRFLEENELRIEDVMTKDNLVTAPADTSLEEADRILTKNKVEKLLLVDDDYRLKGLITIKDIDKLHRYPNACKDARGRPQESAQAVGVHDYERIRALIKADVDVLIVDLGPRQQECDRDRRADQAQLCDRGVGWQRGDLRRNPRPDRGGGRRRQGGIGALLDLHRTASSRASGVRAPDRTGRPMHAAAAAGLSWIADGGIRYLGDTKAIAAAFPR